ncbi:MAG: hypothetical protein GX910_00380 [Clostridiaceae bacterium]|nr:hypothetical protein [Clostridiaceae bacterium]
MGWRLKRFFKALRKKPASAVPPEEKASSPHESPDPFFNPFGRFADAVITQMNERATAYEEKTQNEIKELLSHIAVISFVGESGSGKSTRAIQVARAYRIEYIIDDGLLIRGSSIIAGTSAKRAETKMDSVRQAMFLDPVRAENMRRALVEHLPSALMILGTSDAMLLRICQHLWLTPPSIKIRIEDVTTEEERNLARNTRMSEGMHTIPVPSMEIKHEFSGYLAEPLAKWWQRIGFGNVFGTSSSQTPYGEEHTVVRPTFSTLGHYAMTDQAMKDLIRLLALQVPGISDVVESKIKKEPYGVILDIDLAVYYGASARTVLAETQTIISEGVERFTSINVLVANVRAVRVAIAN